MNHQQVNNIIGSEISFYGLHDDQSVSTIGSDFSRDEDDFDFESDESERRFAVSKTDSLPRIPRSSSDLKGLGVRERRTSRRRRLSRTNLPPLKSKSSAPVLGGNLGRIAALSKIEHNRPAMGLRWESTVSMASSRWESSTDTKNIDQCSIMIPRRKRSKRRLMYAVDNDPTSSDVAKTVNEFWTIREPANTGTASKKDVCPKMITRRWNQGTKERKARNNYNRKESKSSERRQVSARLFNKFTDDIYTMLADSSENKMFTNIMT